MGKIYERKINYYETDKMGIVHHSNYIRYFEEARCEYMTMAGLPYKEMEDNGVLIPVTGVKCEYKTPVKFEDVVEIKAVVSKFTGVRMDVKYIITNKNTGDLVVTGETNHCFVDEDFRPVNLKKKSLEMYNRILNWVNIGEN